MSDDKSVEKVNKGQFVKGKSGNPNGKPKGSKNKLTLVKQAIEQELVEQLADDARSILAKAIKLAKGGDTMMIKLVLDKLMPNAREGSGVTLDKAGGGINIIISGIEKPTINAERVDKEE